MIFLKETIFESFKEKMAVRCKLDVVQDVGLPTTLCGLVLRWVWQEDHQTTSKSQT